MYITAPAITVIENIVNKNTVIFGALTLRARRITEEPSTYLTILRTLKSLKSLKVLTNIRYCVPGTKRLKYVGIIERRSITPFLKYIL